MSSADGNQPADSFESDSQRVLGACRRAFSLVLDALPGSTRTASDLHRTLGVDMKLAWQVYKFARTESIVGAVHMPGRPNVRKVVSAAKRLGVDSALLSDLTGATDEFDRLVDTHAGDRSTFESMVSTQGTEDGDGLNLRQKRAAFRANRHLRGAQATAQLKSLILRPSANPDFLDLVAIQGYTGLRRVRHDVSLVVSRVRIADDDRAVRASHWEPLGSTPARGETSLLGAFCSPNLPPFRAARNAADFVLGELVGNGVGNMAAVTCVDGYLSRGSVPRYRDASNRYGAMLTWVPIPCETLVVDLVVQEDALGSITPIVGCFSTALVENQLHDAMDSCDRLPLNESVVLLGKGLPAMASPDLPRHAEMYGAVFEKLGWASEAFSVYRCRIAFPLMLSSVLVRFDLPERSARQA